jgi:hypothetical protein
MPRVSLAACVPVLVLLALAPPFAAAGGTDGSHHDACGCVAFVRSAVLAHPHVAVAVAVVVAE